MSVPINKVDYQRFVKLAELILRKGKDTDLNLYVGSDGDYVHLEIRGRRLPKSEVLEIFEESNPTERYFRKA